MLPVGSVHNHIDARCLVTPRTSRQNRRREARFAERTAHLDNALPLRERLRPIQDRVLGRPTTGLAADKMVYDALNGRT